MRLIVVRETGAGAERAGMGMLEYAFSTDPLQGVFLNGARRLACPVEGQKAIARLVGGASAQDIAWVVPQPWHVRWPAETEPSLGYTATAGIDLERLEHVGRHPWFAVSDGRFAAQIKGSLFEQVLKDCDADVLAVIATPELLAYREHVRLTHQGELVGYRRLYRDTAQPIPLPRDWPHHFFIKSEYVETVFADGVLQEFGAVIEKCRSCGLNARAVSMAGFVADLGTPAGWLTLSEMMLKETRLCHMATRVRGGGLVAANGHDGQISADARFMGPVLVGREVCVEAGATVIGPSILCQGSMVRRDAVVDASVLGTQVVIEPEQTLTNSFLAATGEASNVVRSSVTGRAEDEPEPVCHGSSVFRGWSRFSYARCLKRIVDIVVAVIVSLLFVPIIPVMALAIKISSPGPVFFKHRRQGLHGRFFNCIKFRTMRVGADDIQDKLRFVCEVDGPQFKMADDPRISTVGRFLRETYLDEIPQFFNVLCGQMSVVGPRPSPESENTLCPSWRDARLSVRPGITGLWQVNRTRRPFKDFQEWIYYDTQYVRELSPRMDLWICWRTFMKMIENFIHQF